MRLGHAPFLQVTATLWGTEGRGTVKGKGVGDHLALISFPQSAEGTPR